MKEFVRPIASFLGKASLLVIGLCYVFPTEAAAQNTKEWPMNNLSGNWYYDTTNRRLQNNHRFNIGFRSSRVSFSNGKLVASSDNYPTGSQTAFGGGIRHNTAFNGNKIIARCRMVANGSTSGSSGGGSNSLQMQVKRSQASFWLEPSGRVSHEIDFFELKPNQVNVVNFIRWDNGRRRNIGLKDWGNLSSATNWGTYRCTKLNNGTRFRCQRGGNSITFNKLNTHNVGTRINIHNKPWRFDNVNIPGKVAKLECAWADR